MTKNLTAKTTTELREILRVQNCENKQTAEAMFATLGYCSFKSGNHIINVTRLDR